MIIVGLTGGIASGKSTVAEMFKNKGAVVLDADSAAKEVVSVEEPAWKEIVDYFGGDILLRDRNIDRKKLGDIVFNNPEARDKLNSIVHPRVIEKFVKETEELKNKNKPPEALIYDVPLLVEAGMHQAADVVVLVYTSPEVQKQRLAERDGFSGEEIDARLSSQMPLEEKKKYADYTINNDGSIKETLRQVDEFWNIMPVVKNKQ